MSRKGGYVILDLTKILLKYASADNTVSLSLSDLEDDEINEISKKVLTKKPILLTINDERLYTVTSSGSTATGVGVANNMISNQPRILFNISMGSNGPANLQLQVSIVVNFVDKELTSVLITIPQLAS